MAETVVIRFKGEDDVSGVAKKVESEVKDIGEAAKDSEKKFGSLGDIGQGALSKIGQLADSAKGSLGKLGTIGGAALAGIGGIALDVGKDALGGVANFFTTAVQGSMDYQKALAQTEAVIKSTGGAAGITVKEMEDTARALSAVSGQSLFTDDQLLGAQNVLATFTEIKGANFGAATGAIADISQALGQDLQSSAIQVGKALNDPVAGISALSRVGVSFTDDQKAMIESMVEAGDVAGAQEIILAELGREFGGSAAAAAGTFSGQMTVMSEKLEDAKGAIGDALLPMLTEMIGIFDQHVMPIITDVTARIGEFFQSINDNGGVMGNLEGIRDVIMEFVDGNPIIQRLIDLWNVLSDSVKSLFADSVELASDDSVQSWMSHLLGILEQVALIIIDVVIVAINLLSGAFSLLVDGIIIFADAMKPIFDYVYPKLEEFLGAISKLLRGDFTGAWNDIKRLVSGIWDDIKSKTSEVTEDIKTRVSTFIDEVIGSAKKLGDDIVNGIVDGINKAKNAVKDALMNIIKSGIDGVKSFLGIASPSRMMADIVGTPMAQGIAAGIASGIPDIQRALNVAVTAATGAPTQTVQNFYLTANYQTAQSQSSLTADLRAMQLLAGGVA